MKKLILLLSTLILTSCSTTWRLSTVGYDPNYSTEILVPSDVKIDTLNLFQLRRKLRTDFRFRLDYAEYAMRQPQSFDWNNRILGNRYNFYRPYNRFGYNHYWNRDQMWTDWAWGYNWYSPYRWSPFGYDRWGYNNYGWNNYYGWNTWNNYNNYYRRGNVANIYGRRSSISQVGRQGISARIESPSRQRIIKPVNNVDIIAKDIRSRIKINNNDKTINTNPRGYERPESSNNGRWSRSRQNIPVKPARSIIPTSNQPRQVRGGSRPSSIQQSRSSSTVSRQRSSGTRR